MDELNVIYQDDYLMIIDKPAGLVVTPTETQHVITLSEILQQKYGINIDRGGIVHRLDKDTSGLLVTAKTQEVLEELQRQFKEREVKKEYLALAHGHLSEIREVDEPIGRNPGNRENFIVLAEGKEAKTRFEPIEQLALSDERLDELFPDYSKIQRRKLISLDFPSFTLVRCFPFTGRTHQIRVHLKYINHPIVGDERYAGRKMSRLDHRLVGRQFLHAAKLSFNHPKSGEKLTFESPLPDDLSKALALLKQ